MIFLSILVTTLLTYFLNSFQQNIIDFELEPYIIILISFILGFLAYFIKKDALVGFIYACILLLSYGDNKLFISIILIMCVGCGYEIKKYYYSLSKFEFRTLALLILSTILTVLSLDKSILLFIILKTAVIDTCQKIVGKITPQALKYYPFPSLSPNKTITGYIGGYFLSYYCSLFAAPDVNYWTYQYVLAVSGDLFFSRIKRKLNIKDYGTFFGEMGGFLDRFASHIFVLALLFIKF